MRGIRLGDLQIKSVCSRTQHLLDSLLKAVHLFTAQISLFGPRSEEREFLSLSALVPRVLPMVHLLCICNLTLNCPDELLPILEQRPVCALYLWSTSLPNIDQILDLMKAKATSDPHRDYLVDYSSGGEETSEYLLPNLQYGHD